MPSPSKEFIRDRTIGNRYTGRYALLESKGYIYLYDRRSKQTLTPPEWTETMARSIEYMLRAREYVIYALGENGMYWSRLLKARALRFIRQ